MAEGKEGWLQRVVQKYIKRPVKPYVQGELPAIHIEEEYDPKRTQPSPFGRSQVTTEPFDPIEDFDASAPPLGDIEPPLTDGNYRKLPTPQPRPGSNN